MRVEFTDLDVLRDGLTDREVSYDIDRGTVSTHTVLEWEALRPDLVITRARGTRIGLDRTERLVRQSSIDDLTFSITIGATGSLAQDHSAVATTPGSGTFYTSSRPMRLGLDDGYDNLMIQVDRRRLRRLIGEDIPLGLQAPGTNLGLTLLTDMATRLVGSDVRLSIEERHAFGAAIEDLLAAVVLSSRSGRPVRPNGPDALLEVLKADVLSRLHDPDLSPADLAARHRISLRYVHRLFGSEPPATFIRRHRLRLAADLLARGTPQQLLPVASVALRCGFQDRGTFIRAFRREFGCTPTEYRNLTIIAGGRRPV